ncbi:MAG: PilN domain-containing protein, partial [Desulfobacteraceae bacterium]|nr:PilN domain-containing protein [Desulfobacteraceae bacterium]
AGSMDAGVSGVQIHTTAVANFIWNDVKQIIKTNSELFVFYADEKILDIICFKNGIYDYSRQVTIDGSDDALLELINNEIKNKRDNKSSDQVETAVVFCGTGITQSICKHFDNDPGVSRKKHGFEKYSFPSDDFIPAFGLALNGLVRKLALPINLLPENKRKKASKAASYTMYSLIFMAIVFGILWGVGHFMHQNMINKNIDAQLLRLEKEVGEINLKKAEISKLEKKIKTINRLVMEQVEINKVLNELSEIIPSGSWLRSFVFKIDKGIRIMGESDAASDLIPILESSPLFKNCVFQSAITKNNNGKERFSIGCDIIMEGADN